MNTKTTDYISRRDLLARYDAEHTGAPGRARELIEQAPAADVAPVVHGVPVIKNRESREVVYLQAGEENGEILYKRYVYVDKTDWVEYCSVCGKRLCSRFNNYCPNCGAKMDKEDT